MSSMPESPEHKVFICDNSANDLNLNINTNSLRELSECKGLSLSAFLCQLISNVNNNSEKCDVWSDVLLDVIDNNVIQMNDSMLFEVLNTTVIKSKSQSMGCRLFACKLLAKLSTRLDQFVVNNKILPLVQCLCHDLESVIRVHMCRQLFPISRNISLETTKNQILPQLIELSKDDENIVRIATIESLIDFLSTLDSETIVQIVLPLIVVMFEKAFESKDNSLPLIFINFGKLCQTLPKDLIAQENWFLHYYCNIYSMTSGLQLLSKDEDFKERDIQCRTVLAINFPVMLQKYGAIDSLLSILDSLCFDENIIVFKTIASVFDQIIASLENPYIIYPQLSKLLCRRSIDILKALMLFFDKILIAIIISTPVDKFDILCENLVQNLTECENTLSSYLDWRSHVDFFENLSRLMPYIPVNLIKSNLISMLINRILKGRGIPRRVAASRCVLITFRDIPILLQDLDIYRWFVDNLCYANSCYDRMLFIKVCEMMHELCDKSIIVSYIFEPLLHLRKDRVPNVRLNTCKTFKLFSSLLTTVPEISVRLNKLKLFFLLMLKNERDRDVLESINALIDCFQWREDFNKVEMEELTFKFDNMSISCSQESQNFKDVNKNVFAKQDINSNRIDSNKYKSSLPQPIRSNSKSITPLISSTNIVVNGLHAIPSKIPKPINKSIK